MAPARARFCPLPLLLLLGLWVAEVPVSAKPKHMTSAQWLETQHVQPRPQACKGPMGNVNKRMKPCKGLSTFLHESFSSVAAPCHTPIITCKNGHESCHQSQRPVSLTTCEGMIAGTEESNWMHSSSGPVKDELRYLLVPMILGNAV
ncbi:PREDICTED: ribonuclease 8-like [Miniopterus natalensis]|uniref:ribonuclease 8-like n=1 Tax=Miniopterus natalensis TaxID=291302 RepID=UPI0007A6E3D2|nr:PREDICTED: ribonuclease 8-like [Miniopterus natalensis]